MGLTGRPPSGLRAPPRRPRALSRFPTSTGVRARRHLLSWARPELLPQKKQALAVHPSPELGHEVLPSGHAPHGHASGSWRPGETGPCGWGGGAGRGSRPRRGPSAWDWPAGDLLTPCARAAWRTWPPHLAPASPAETAVPAAPKGGLSGQASVEGVRGWRGLCGFLATPTAPAQDGFPGARPVQHMTSDH